MKKQMKQKKQKKTEETESQMLPRSYQIHDCSPVLLLLHTHVIEEDPVLSGWTPEKCHIVHATVANHAMEAVQVRLGARFHPEDLVHPKLWLDHGKERPELVTAGIGAGPHQGQDEGFRTSCQPTLPQKSLSRVALSAVSTFVLSTGESAESLVSIDHRRMEQLVFEGKLNKLGDSTKNNVHYRSHGIYEIDSFEVSGVSFKSLEAPLKICPASG